MDILAKKSVEKTACLNHSHHLSHHPHAFDLCSANGKKVFAFTREQSTKDDATSLLDL